MAVKAKYQPFSFQERLAPLAMLQEQYDKVNENLLTLGEQAKQYYQYLDPETRSIVDKYNTELSNVAGSLATEGLKTVNRNTLTRLRTLYNDSVKPINEAAQTLAKMYEDQRSLEGKLNASGQRLFSSTMPTVKDLLNNPGATPQNVSSGALYAQGQQAAKSDSMRQFSESAFGNEIIRGYIRQITEQGYSPEVIARFMNDVNTIPALREAYESIKQMYGTDVLTDPDAANQFIMRGILDGIVYSKDVSYKEDIIGKENRAFARQQAMARLNADLEVETAARKAALAGKSGADSGAKRTIVSPRARSVASLKFYDSKTGEVKIPNDIFDKDGKLRDPNKALGVGHMSGNIYMPPSSTRSADDYNKLMSILREYYTDEQIANMTKDDVTKVLNGVINDSLLDAQGNSGYYWNLDISNTKELLSRVGELPEVVSKEGGKWRYSPKTKNVLEEQKGKSSQLIYDPVSDEMFLSFDNSSKMYHLPKSVISDQDLIGGLDHYHIPGNIPGFEGMNRMDAARKTMDSAAVTLNDFNARLQRGEQLSKEEQAIYMNAYEQYLSALEVQEEADALYSTIGPTIMTYLNKQKAE